MGKKSWEMNIYVSRSIVLFLYASHMIRTHSTRLKIFCKLEEKQLKWKRKKSEKLATNFF